MNNEGTTKAPKDKNCPYCGQAFTSSSLGRHLDLYIKEKNPKAPDGIHDVDEIRKIRGGITRRQPRGGSRRETTSAYRGSQASSKRNSGDSDGETDSVQSPGDGTTGYNSMKGSNSQRTFNRQVLKTSVDAKQKFQDALDTAKAAELALREMIGSWRAAKRQVNLESMPFDFNPLSLDFPALCLQCLEPPPTLFSSMPQPTSSSWSVTPPSEKQKEAVSVYFRDQFRKWKMACASATAAATRETSSSPSQSNGHHGSRPTAHKAQQKVELLEKQVFEHLNTSYHVWKQLTSPRQQELWILEMARTISRKSQEVEELKQSRSSLRQENTNLKSQIDHLNQEQLPKEFKFVPPMTMRVDDRLAELWTDAGACGAEIRGLKLEDQQHDLSAVVTGAIERWKGVIVAYRASGMTAQRSLDQALQTPMSAVHPMSPEMSRPTDQVKFQGCPTTFPQASPNSQTSVGRNRSVSAAHAAATVMYKAKTSAASTPVHSPAGPQEDIDIDPEDEEEDADADGEADIEMEEESDYLSAATTPTHHTMSQIQTVQHHIARPQTHPMHPSVRAQDQRQQQHMAAARHSLYSQAQQQRSSGYGTPVVLASQQMHMTPQAFGHQLQSLEHHLTQQGSGGPGWGNGH